MQTNNSEDIPPIMVDVVAPANLPAGYKFEAQADNKVFTAVVPEGGVHEGQTFTTPIYVDEDGYVADNAPQGEWKDGLFGFCNFGFLHPSLWCSLFCTQIGMSQVMTRMNLNWFGMPLRLAPGEVSPTCKIVTILVLSYIIFTVLLEILFPTPPEGMEDYYRYPPIIEFIKVIVDVAFTLYCLFALMKVREAVRYKYSIPERHCEGCEDFCCSVWCSCCTVAQLSRQVNDYEKNEGKWFTRTGVPDHVAPLV